MFMPTAVFLDTSILAGQQYNFASIAFSTFIPVAKKAALKYILPDPTEREIKRQIQARKQEALKALEGAMRKAPFLAKWKSFPNAAQFSTHDWELTQIATAEVVAFFRNFDVVRLGYDKLDLKLVMDWYDGAIAPFGEGKKRKEFPDAFSIAMLDSYANSNDCFVAVVSEDQDFKVACDRFPKLLYFQSLPRLTELLLSAESAVTKYHDAIQAKAEELEEVIRNQMDDIEFDHDDYRFEIVSTSLHHPSVHEISVVAVGDNECTITFEAGFEAEHQLMWEDYNGPRGYLNREIGDVYSFFSLTGVAKIRFDFKTSEMIAITHVTLDDEKLSVSRMPKGYWY
jgi:hypothetical protein